VSEWQPIESAPKDVLLIFRGAHSYELGFWDGLIYRNQKSGSLEFMPSLWAKIPGAPYHLFPEFPDKTRTEIEQDALRYRFIKKHGMPQATRAPDGSRLWYKDRVSDNVEIVRPKFDDCIDAAMAPTPP
jgi:hypothetical protein